MRIAFDGTTLTPGRTGVGYYTEHLLQHLAREVEVAGDELIVISNQPIDTAQPLPRHVRVYDRRRFPLRIGWMQLMAARVLEDIRADVAHFTNGMLPLGTGAARVVTIHDMSLTLFPRCHPLRRLVINRPLLERGGARRPTRWSRYRTARGAICCGSTAFLQNGSRVAHEAAGPGIHADRRIRRAWRGSARATDCPSDSCCTSGRSSRARTCRG